MHWKSDAQGVRGTGRGFVTGGGGESCLYTDEDAAGCIRRRGARGWVARGRCSCWVQQLQLWLQPLLLIIIYDLSTSTSACCSSRNNDCIDGKSITTTLPNFFCKHRKKLVYSLGSKYCSRRGQCKYDRIWCSAVSLGHANQLPIPRSGRMKMTDWNLTDWQCVSEFERWYSEKGKGR